MKLVCHCTSKPRLRRNSLPAEHYALFNFYLFQLHHISTTGDLEQWCGTTPELSVLACLLANCLSQSALFNFQSLLLVILLLICTSAYVHNLFPTILDRNKQGLMGIFWKAARIGERLSPYISLCCVFMAVSMVIGT
ncbi:hypothetical protein F4678DRAFT_462119 [Xylaria arbuscula]|nr:hypothetical protein F4678DRAFT_462119 [Xylaria arbuscula]